MAQLAIKGHATRGNEVIEILEMLGGENRFQREGDNKDRFYYIDKNKHIQTTCGSLSYTLFTLEEFFKKYPYKIGDKVNYVKYNDEYPSEYTIQRMRWTGATIEYLLDSSGFSALTKDLQLYKDKPDLLQQLKDYFDNTPREVVEKEWHEYDKYNEIGPTVNEYLEYVNKIRQPKYSKTY